jgi:hypothetical protein
VTQGRLFYLHSLLYRLRAVDHLSRRPAEKHLAKAVKYRLKMFLGRLEVLLLVQWHKLRKENLKGGALCLRIASF